MFQDFLTYLQSHIAEELVIRLAIFFVPAGILFYVTHYLLKNKLALRKVQQKDFQGEKIKYDILISGLNRVILSFVTVGIAWAILGNYTLIYTDISKYGIAYFIFSIALVFVIHDTYFYFFHRLMHHRLFMQKVHRVHHHSTDPTPFTSYTFHPWETIIEFAFLPLIVFILPLHIYAFYIWQFGGILLFTMYAHLGYEIMPKFWVNNPLTKYINTPTHHNMHHSKFNYNYGLYFNVWDRLLGTQHKDYDATFNEVVSRRNA